VGEEDTIPIPNPIRHHDALLKLHPQGVGENVSWDVEELVRRREQFISRQTAMSFRHGFAEDIGDTGIDTLSK